MIITIHQPEHLPWLGFFNKLSKAEVFVILDSVQFEKNYFQNRNKIMVAGNAQWLGIPVMNQGHMSGSIATTQIAAQTNPKWRQKYIQSIKMNYARHPYFDEVFPVLEEALNTDDNNLCEINIAIIKKFSEKLGYHPRFVRSSELELSGMKSDLILDICKVVGATTYIAGPSGRDYLDMKSFEDANIKVVFNDFKHPTYSQKKVQEFVPYLSALDLFMNCGFEESAKIIIEGNEGTSEF